MTDDLVGTLYLVNKLPEMVFGTAAFYFGWRCLDLLQRIVNSMERHR